MSSTKTKTYDRKEFGRKIRIARIGASLSQSDLANAIGVSDRAISAYEKGRNTPPVEKLQRIADKTNYSLRFFVGEEDHLGSAHRILANIEAELKEVNQLLSSIKNKQ